MELTEPWNKHEIEIRCGCLEGNLKKIRKDSKLNIYRCEICGKKYVIDGKRKWEIL